MISCGCCWLFFIKLILPFPGRSVRGPVRKNRGRVYFCDPRQIFEHAKRVPQQTDFAARPLPPHDRNLADRKIPLPGKIQHFDIETEAVQFLKPEKILRGFARKTLKTALRVPDAAQNAQLH